MRECIPSGASSIPLLSYHLILLVIANTETVSCSVMKVSEDSVVTIEYRMVNQKGDLVDSSDHGESLSFIQGRNTILPGIEHAIEGRKSGERLTFTLPPEEGYGIRDEAKVAVIPRTQLNSNGELRIGMQFYTQKNGYDLPVTITHFSDEEVTVDGNHPLAGETMNIDLVIIEVRQAIDSELESGKVQDDEELYRISANQG